MGNLKEELYLRPNACIAMALAPELFNKQNAIQHLDRAEAFLLEEQSLGIKTLDLNSDDFVSYYDNADDSTNMKTAHGYSYHNGPVSYRFVFLITPRNGSGSMGTSSSR